MAHGNTQAGTIDALTQSRIKVLTTPSPSGLKMILNFAVLIDTHRDQPHVGSFDGDIHRGQCKPTAVHYNATDDTLVAAEDLGEMKRHDKHMFVTHAFFGQFLMDYMMEEGSDPRDGEGRMPTSHFRNARPILDANGNVIKKPTYELKSFREIVRLKQLGQA